MHYVNVLAIKWEKLYNIENYYRNIGILLL